MDESFILIWKNVLMKLTKETLKKSYKNAVKGSNLFIIIYMYSNLLHIWAWGFNCPSNKGYIVMPRH